MTKTYKDFACYVLTVVIFAASAAVLLWDGTARFNKVHWRCHYHAHHIHTGNDTAANATMTSLQYFRNTGSVEPVVYMYDNDNNNGACDDLYSQAVAEYVFGCFTALIAFACVYLYHYE